MRKKLNLQLFGYDDGFYYGQCKLICVADSAADDGKTVSITGEGRSFSATLVDQVASFLLPGRGLYTVAMIDSGVTEWSGTVECGYGECIELHLADGYEVLRQKDKLTLGEIEIATGSLADYVPDADAVKTLNNNFQDQVGTFEFRDNSGVAEYRKSGADTWSPFKENKLTKLAEVGFTIRSGGYTLLQECDLLVLTRGSAGVGAPVFGTSSEITYLLYENYLKIATVKKAKPGDGIGGWSFNESQLAFTIWKLD